MRRPEDDVALTNGDGYMVGIERYTAHLNRAKESDSVSCFGVSRSPFIHVQI